MGSSSFAHAPFALSGRRATFVPPPRAQWAGMCQHEAARPSGDAEQVALPEKKNPKIPKNPKKSPKNQTKRALNPAVPAAGAATDGQTKEQVPQIGAVSYFGV